MGEHLLSVAGPFVGRARELRLLEAAGSAAARGVGSVTVVAGEAGIGKTRLCDEAAARAGAAGLTVVSSRCWLEGGAPALWPWRPIVHDLCGADATRLLGADRATVADVDPDRFARFAAVTDQLAAAAARAPVCLVIDDVHAADAGTLLLLRFVTRSLPRLRMAVVLSRRSGGTAAGPLEERLLDDIESEATPIALQRLDDAEAVEFLVAHGLGDLDHSLLAAVVRVSGGNPLHLRRIAALGEPHPDRGIPEGLQVAIEASVARLSPPTRRVLAAAALLGLAPSVAESAAVTGVDAADVLDAAADAAAAGLVHLDRTDRFAFGHELVRATFAAGLSARERLDVHARAAPAVAGEGTAVPSDRLTRRAYHAVAAAPRSRADARSAVAACRAAADAMVEGFAYEQADGLLTSAVDLHDGAGLGAPPVRLLVEWARAAYLCGRMADARARFDRAATAAERDDDVVGFAEAALGLGGHWVNEHRQPVERTRVLALQRAALARLPTGRDAAAGTVAALRVRLEARLAAEAVYGGGPVEPVFAALAAARQCPDRAARAEALSLVHHALLAPEHAELRLELADELVAVASEAGHGVLGLMGLCWRAIDLYLLGDARADRALEDLRERADALACQNILYIVGVIDVMRLVRAGRLDEAEAAAQRCYELGTEVGEVDTFGYLAGQTLAIRWIQGRDHELLATAEAAATSPTLVQGEFGFLATFASLAARSGERATARAALDRLAAGGLARLPRSSTWLVGMVAIVEAAAVLGDRPVAREAYGLLLPFADRPVMPSLAVVCLGSTERSLGLAASTFGAVDEAVRHFERAVAANRRLGNVPMVAIAEADLARALRRRDATAATPPAGSGRAAERPSPPAGRRAGVLRREGRGWLVGVDDRRVFLPDLVGLAYLAELVRHPGQPLAALTLAAGEAVPEPSTHDVLDERARAAYGARLRELTAELDEADAAADRRRAERLRAEADALVDHLEEATGLHGRSRAFTHQAERARTAVRKAIKRALDEIDGIDPMVAEALRSTVTTGATCVYVPDPAAPVRWET